MKLNLKQTLISKSWARLGLTTTALVTALCTTLSPAQATNAAYEKVALVVGNTEYLDLPDLPNATNDARAVAEMLEQSGYLVFEETDLTKSGFSAAVAELSANLNSSSEVVFFFAGHGFQIGSENYLIPTNSDISDLSDVPLESISLTHILEHFATQSGAQIVLLDSCRENPFAGKQVYTNLSGNTLRIENGFSFQSAPVNSLLSFSTAPGAVALDGEGSNSPYTASLVQNIRANPEEDIASILPMVRKEVFDNTNGAQVPWESSSLLKPVFLSKPARTITRPSNKTSLPAISFNAEKEVLIEGPVSKHVSLSKYNLTADDNERVTVASLPKSGWLGVTQDTTIRKVRLGEELSVSEMANLTYSPNLSAKATGRGLALISDEVRLRRGKTDVSLDINLSYHACDVAAASPLDPQGVGLSVENFQMVPDRALAACSEAVRSYPNESRFHYQLFRAQLAKKLFDEAAVSVKQALELGHIRANLGMGQLKLLQAKGVGTTKNGPVSPDVLGHYLDGHQKGDPIATYTLGRQLIRHGETAADRQRGFALLHRAKDAGYVEALNELARYFFVSEAGDSDPSRGLRYFEEAAERGNYQGFNGLGFVYKNGLGGIDPDFEKAVVNFETAADLGHRTAPTSLGRIWAEGALVKPDFKKSFSWYEEGLIRGDPWGGTNAANLILLGKLPKATKADAALLGAKAAAIASGSSRKAAQKVLSKLDKRDLATGLQMLLVELGAKIKVDGDPGRATAAAVVDAYGALVPLETAGDLSNALTKVAAVYWQKSDVRVDLN